MKSGVSSMKYAANSTVWITGASSGIGKALAEAYIKKDWQVILSARDENKLTEISNIYNHARDNITLAPLDLSKHDTIPEVVKTVLAKVGKVDVLINNAGVSQRCDAISTPLEIDKYIMNVNYFGAVALTKALLPAMLARKRGHIAVISSVQGKIGTRNRSAYAASKHALHGFFDSLRAETAGEGIFITLACPGWIKTDISLNALVADGSKYDIRDNRQEKGLNPETCAKRIIRAIESGKEEVIIGGWETYAVWLKRFAPRLLSRLLRRFEAK
jgi:short-subunit dehydrogenase